MHAEMMRQWFRAKEVFKEKTEPTRKMLPATSSSTSTKIQIPQKTSTPFLERRVEEASTTKQETLVSPAKEKSQETNLLPSESNVSPVKKEKMLTSDDLSITNVISGRKRQPARPISIKFDKLMKKEISEGRWLTTATISLAMSLIKKSFPDQPGLERTECGPKKSFSVQKDAFLQILHNGKDHWVTYIRKALTTILSL